MGGTQQVWNLLPPSLVLFWVRPLSRLWLNLHRCHLQVYTEAFFLRPLHKLALPAPFLSCPALSPRHWHLFSCALSVSHAKMNTLLGKDFVLFSALSQYLDQCLAHSSEWVNWWTSWGNFFRGRRILGRFFLLNMDLWAHLTSEAIHLYFELLLLYFEDISSLEEWFWILLLLQ